MAKSKIELVDALAADAAENLNKKFKGTNYKVAYFLDGDTDTPADVNEFVGTGTDSLDLAIANRPHGGFPVGRISEITGLEASGKSLLAAHALVSTQKKGGLAVYIDTESAVSRDFLSAIGLNLEKMLYVPLETVEDIFESIENIVETVRKSSKDRLVTIVVDSIMGASTKIEMAAEYDKDGYATSKSIILSKAMRKLTNMIARERICLIFTNQLRSRFGIAFGDPWTTSGGKAIPFHSSVRLRLKSVGQIKVGDAIVGIKTRCQVIKNRIGPPLKMVDYDIYFESGIDNFGGLLTSLVDCEVITQAGAHYTYVDKSTGEIIKFTSKTFQKKLAEYADLYTKLYDELCTAYIFKYRPGIDGGINDVTYTDTVIPEDD